MNRIATLAPLIGLLLVVPPMATGAETEQAIADARAAHEAADAVGFAWRDTATIIKMAEEAAKKGDDARAQQLAEIARFQGEAAIAQSRREPEKPPEF
jgi:hypothetical protein